MIDRRIRAIRTWLAPRGVPIFAALALLGGIYLLRAAPAEPDFGYGVTSGAPATEGELAPDFLLADARSGEGISLSQFRGTPLLLNFSATWCVTCVAEFRNFEQAQAVLAGRGQVLVVDYHQPRKTVLDLIVPLGIERVPVLLDSEGTVTRHFRVFGLPTTVLIDADGVVARVSRGFMSPEAIRLAFGSLGVEYALPTGVNP